MDLMPILDRIERLREVLYDQQAMLREVSDQQEEANRLLRYIAKSVSRKGSSQPQKSSSSSKLIALVASLWGAGFLGWLGVLKGEHIGTILQILQKSH